MTVTEVVAPVGSMSAVFELTSECVDDRIWSVEALVIGPAFGGGVGFLSYGDVSLHDHYNDVDLSRFSGSGQVSIGSISPGIGLGVYAVRLGESGGLGSYGIHGSGAGVTFGPGLSWASMLGSTTLLDASYEDCDCDAK
jgi:hypothetical protein